MKKILVPTITLGLAGALLLTAGVSSSIAISPSAANPKDIVLTENVKIKYSDSQKTGIDAAIKLFWYYTDEQKRIATELIGIQSRYLAGGADSVERKRLGNAVLPYIVEHADRTWLLRYTSPESFIQGLGFVKTGILSELDSKKCVANAEKLSFRPALVTVKHRVEVKQVAEKLNLGRSKGSLSDAEGKVIGLKVEKLIADKTTVMEVELLAKVSNILNACGINKN
jgi:hypothetical protein